MAEHPAVVFLRAELDRVEQLARAATSPDGPVWTHNPGDHWLIVGQDGPLVYDEGTPTAEQAAHIALHDPAAVLRRVSADRQILAEHGSQDDGGLGAYQRRVCAHRPEGDWYHYLVPYPCRTVLLLAEAWGWTEETA